MVREIDFDAINLTEEELNDKLFAYELVRSIAHGQKQQSKNLFICTPVNDILSFDFLRTYKIPLCFRDVDDDLDVEPNQDNILDVLE